MNSPDHTDIIKLFQLLLVLSGIFQAGPVGPETLLPRCVCVCVGGERSTGGWVGGVGGCFLGAGGRLRLSEGVFSQPWERR